MSGVQKCSKLKESDFLITSPVYWPKQSDLETSHGTGEMKVKMKVKVKEQEYANLCGLQKTMNYG